MKTRDAHTHAAEPLWRRLARYFTVYAEAMDTSPYEHQNRRLSDLEIEVATLKRLIGAQQK